MNNYLKKNKRMMIMLAVVTVIFGGIFAYKAVVGVFIKKYMLANSNPLITISAMPAVYDSWQPQLKASGGLVPVLGVDVTTEIAGLIRTVAFTPGSTVKKDDLLVQLNADSDVAHLNSLQAIADLANTTYNRDKEQFAIKAVSQAILDADAADLRSKQAQVNEQAAIVAKKTIRAPFAGTLGIAYVNPGQYVNPGDKLVTLQSLDPIYVDFYIPQQALPQVSVKQKINMTTDTYPGKTFPGVITTIEPKVDTTTRNVKVEATVANPKNLLLPGMFATVEVDTGTPIRYLTLPKTAVAYNPYGDIVYLVEKKGTNDQGEPELTVKQVFVTVGPTRGDQVAIIKGIKEGDTVVTSGQLKLKNGSRVVINNKVVPSNNPNPTPVDE